MRIGIDFDNTIACYEGVFHAAALERNLIPADLPTDKNAVRDYLNGSGRKDAFTELQGYVYGARMALVAPYEGFEAFMARALAEGHELFVISHKTRHPILGPKHDLHAAARDFLVARGLCGTGAGHIAEDRIFFELTKEEKIARVAALAVDVFIDDLPEILVMAGFPDRVTPILFDPHGSYPGGVPGRPEIAVCRGWDAVTDTVLGPVR
jgi:hypothetical protein